MQVSIQLGSTGTSKRVVAVMIKKRREPQELQDAPETSRKLERSHCMELASHFVEARKYVTERRCCKMGSILRHLGG